MEPGWQDGACTNHCQVPLSCVLATHAAPLTGRPRDVPEAVSRAFVAYAREGRINFEGILGKIPIRGTLIPRGAGGIVCTSTEA